MTKRLSRLPKLHGPILLALLTILTVGCEKPKKVSLEQTQETAEMPEEKHRETFTCDTCAKAGKALKPVADLVARGESQLVGNYDAANNGTGMDLGKHGLTKVFNGRKCHEITIGEILLAQQQLKVHAVGRYQIIGTTLPFAVRVAGLSGSDMFSPENQDRLFKALVKEKRPAIWSFITGNGSIERAADELALEWASMPAPWGGTFYPGGDKAHATRHEVKEALRSAKNLFQTFSTND